jgi:hypothetical protein
MPRSLSQPRKHLAFRRDTQCILQAAASQLSPAILVSPLHSAAPPITAIPFHLSHFQRSPKMPPSVPWPPSTGVFATYPLQCHCAAIQYTVTVSPPLLESDAEGKGIYTTLECDCTHCERKGIIACHPKLADVKFTQGLVRAVGTMPVEWIWIRIADSMLSKEHRGEYYSGAKKNPHWLCKICGPFVR